jgi:aminoglycoside phosphotransferase (APT) family kinase protein
VSLARVGILLVASGWPAALARRRGALARCGDSSYRAAVADDAMALPDDLVEWIGEVAGGTVTATKRVPGGASREAWFVDVERDTEAVPLFLRYSRIERPADTIFHPLRVEAEIFLALQDTAVTVPRTLGVHPVHEAMLAERVGGETWFYRIRDPEEQVRVAQDFMRNLAALHAVDPRTLHLPSLGPVKTAREHALDEIANMRARATRPDGSIEPFLRFSIDWLERNVPAYDGPVVFVQGDTGPGNFMYENGKVTAVVDWELAHFGDPMDDIAWLSLRTVQDTFTHFPDRIREYEELTGNKVDEDRVWYYRLFAETRLASNGSGAGNEGAESGDGRPVARDVGNGLIYGVLHRRLMTEALAHAMRVDLEPAALPEPPAPQPWHSYYGAVLDNLQVIVPRIDDALASQWTKGVARIVKYLERCDLLGPVYEDDERAEIGRLLGTEASTLAAARAAIEAAVADGTVTDEQYVHYLWHRVQREDDLAKTASGALATRTWPPLFD